MYWLMNYKYSDTNSKNFSDTQNQILILMSNFLSLNQILNITSGTTSSEAEKKYVYTINSDAASMYFSYDNTNRKKIS